MVKPETTRDRHSARALLYLGSICAAVGFGTTLLRSLLPLLQILLPLAMGAWAWRWYRRWQTSQQEALDAVFYDLLLQHQGRLAPLDFAMTAKISAIAARHYLDSKASEFSAQFEVTEAGDVFYVFSTLRALQQSASSGSVDRAAAARAIELEVGDDRHTPPNSVSSPSTPHISPDCLEPNYPLLTQAELARRLGVSASSISRKKLAPDLPEWTQAKDPEGKGWMYIVQAQRFIALE